MRYYYQWQTDSFLTGTDEELRKNEIGYPPGDTMDEALDFAIQHFDERIKYFTNITDTLKARRQTALERADKIKGYEHSGL